jgi:hypothetical protein
MKSAPDDMQCSPSPAPVGRIDEYENIPNRGRFGGNPTNYSPRAMRWLIAGLACFWVGTILLVRSCA